MLVGKYSKIVKHIDATIIDYEDDHYFDGGGAKRELLGKTDILHEIFLNKKSKAIMIFSKKINKWAIMSVHDKNSEHVLYTSSDHADKSVPWCTDFEMSGWKSCMNRWTEQQKVEADRTGPRRVRHVCTGPVLVEPLTFRVQPSAWAKQPKDNPMAKAVQKYAHAMEKDVLALLADGMAPQAVRACRSKFA